MVEGDHHVRKWPQLPPTIIHRRWCVCYILVNISQFAVVDINAIDIDVHGVIYWTIRVKKKFDYLKWKNERISLYVYISHLSLVIDDSSACLITINFNIWMNVWGAQCQTKQVRAAFDRSVVTKLPLLGSVCPERGINLMWGLFRCRLASLFAMKMW